MPPMKNTIAILLLSVFGLVTTGVADENHEIIEKVMKEGLKGEESPATKVIEGGATDDEIKALAELIGTLKGTKTPRGDQGEYEEKVATLIAAIDKVAGGDKSDDAIAAFEDAQSCKPCHSKHKPEKK